MNSRPKKNRYFIMIVLPWTILILSEVFYCHQYFLRVSVGPLSNKLLSSMHIDAENIIVIAVSFYYAYMSMQLVAGILIDRFGSRITISSAAMICAIGSFLFTYVDNPVVAELARVLMGAGAAFSYVGVLVLSKGWFTDKKFALIVGSTTTIGTIGAMLGTTVLYEFLKHYNWQNVMLSMSIIALLIAIFSFIFVQDPGDFIVHKRPYKHCGVIDTIKNSLYEACKIHTVWLCGIYLGCLYVIITAFAALWCTPYYRILYGTSNFFTELTPSLIFIGLGIGSLFFPWLSNLLNNRLLLLIRLGSLFFLFFTILALYTKLPQLLMSIVLLLVGFTLGSSALAFVIVVKWSKKNCRASAISIANLLQMAIGALLLPVMGYVLDIDWTQKMYHHINAFWIRDFHFVFIFIIVTSIIAVVIAFFIKLPHKKTVRLSIHQ
jgi:MFS family permease